MVSASVMESWRKPQHGTNQSTPERTKLPTRYFTLTRDKRSRRPSKLTVMGIFAVILALVAVAVAVVWLHPYVAFHDRDTVHFAVVNKELIESRRQQQELFVQRTHRARIKEHQGDESVELPNQRTALFNYNLPTVRTPQTLPDPKVKNKARLIVLVLSARNHFARRSMIRQTWGHDQTVYFVIGGPDHTNNTAVNDSTRLQLVQEQDAQNDLLDAIHPESYYSLAHKLKYAFHWVIHHCDAAQWILKVDDDMFAHVDRLSESLLSVLNPSSLTVVGRIHQNRPVQRHGKWAEIDYPNPIYPPWPQGSCGYVISRAVAEYVAQQYDRDLTNHHRTTPNLAQLYIYQGEDTSLGIWLERSSLNVFWVHSSFFVNHGDCMVATHSKPRNGTVTDAIALSIGHRISPEQMQKCYDAARNAASHEPDASISRGHLFYLETHAQHTQRTEGESDDTVEDEGFIGKKDEAYLSAIARYQGDQEAANRRVAAKQKTEQRSRRRQQLRALHSANY